MIKKIHKNLIAVLFVVVLYLANKYIFGIFDFQLRSKIIYGLIIIVLVAGIYLVRINAKRFDFESNTSRIIFFIIFF